MDAEEKLRLERESRITGRCAICGSDFVGLFYHFCIDEKCELYNSFAMAWCGICGARRIDCSC